MQDIDDGVLECIFHPARWKILEALAKPSLCDSYVEQIAEKTGIAPRMVSRHIDTLQAKGLVESYNDLIKKRGNRCAIARFCALTPKFKLLVWRVGIEMRAMEATMNEYSLCKIGPPTESSPVRGFIHVPREGP